MTGVLWLHGHGFVPMMRCVLESLLFGSIGIWSIREGLQLNASRREGVFDLLGPDRYIMLVGGILVALSIVRLVTSRAEWQVEQGVGAFEGRRENAVSLQLVLLTLAFAGYALFVRYGGYALTTAAFFAAAYWIMGLRDWLKLTSAVVLSTAAFVILFVKLADMPLPRGMIGTPF